MLQKPPPIKKTNHRTQKPTYLQHFSMKPSYIFSFIIFLTLCAVAFPAPAPLQDIRDALPNDPNSYNDYLPPANQQTHHRFLTPEELREQKITGYTVAGVFCGLFVLSAYAVFFIHKNGY